jgi:hypothetical protein
VKIARGIRQPTSVVAHAILTLGFGLAPSIACAQRPECPPGTVWDHDEQSKSGNVITITPKCRRVTPQAQMTERAAELVAIYDRVTKELNLPKGSAEDRELAALNCQSYFNGVARAMPSKGRRSWEGEFHGLRADGIADKLKTISLSGGDWASVDLRRAQELANDGAIVVGASPADKTGHAHIGFVFPLPPGLDEKAFPGTGPFVRDGNEHEIGEKVYPSTWGAVKASKAFRLSDTNWYVYVPSEQ